MSMLDEAVEAAAKRAWWESEGRPWTHATNDMREPYLRNARLAVEFAAPIISAQAWDEGALAVMGAHDIGRVEITNPYRNDAQ